jgi:membrane-bound lytic murein transglycosylase F
MIAKPHGRFAMAILAIVVLFPLGTSIPACTAPAAYDANGQQQQVTTRSFGIAPPEPTPLLFDLNHIQERGTLVVLTENSSTSYFSYKGQPMGYEYELLDEYCDYMGLELRIRLVDDFDNIFDLLEDGECDLIACNLTITRDRMRRVAFSSPYLNTRQMLVQRLPEGHEGMRSRRLRKYLINSSLELVGQPVHVRKSSSFYPRLLSLENEIGGNIDIQIVDAKVEVEELIQQVASGEIEYTIADENVALMNKHYLHNIDVSVAISLPQQIGWATRINSTELRTSINDWMAAKKSTVNYIGVKYFKAPKKHSEKVNSEFSSLAGGKISIYDSLLKSEVEYMGWDWRLVAALIYQESKFKPHAKSWAGAFGLMQLMPRTASRYNLTEDSAPEKNVRAGIDKLRRLDKHWSKLISYEPTRIKFILASYNAGLGHVQDACRLAERLGKNPFLWDGHVDESLLLMSNPEYFNSPVVRYGYCRGREPYNYVREILNRYEQYSELIKQ